MSGVDISVILSTYNRATMARRALESLAAMDLDPPRQFEIVVVDNASTDNTAEVIEEVASCSPVPVRGVYEARPGLAAARNRGITEAKGAWLAFFDDDQTADPRWLHELLTLAQQKNARCVGGSILLVLEDEGFPEAPAVYQHLLGQGHRPKAVCRYNREWAPGGGHLLVHRDVFEQVGRFDESLINAYEDTEFFHRLCAAGIDVWHTPHAVVRHILPRHRTSETYLRWRSRRDGVNLARDKSKARGTWFVLLTAGARIGQTLLVHAPKLLAAWIRRDAGRALAMRWRLWRTEGYLRTALYLAAPRWFPQAEFFAQQEARMERSLFETQSSACCQDTCS